MDALQRREPFTRQAQLRGGDVIHFVSAQFLRAGEIAALYCQGSQTVVFISAAVTDPQRRVEAVNRLLARSKALTKLRDS